MNIYNLSPTKCIANTHINILHYRRQQTPNGVSLWAKACDRFNYINRVEMTVNEADGTIISCNCGCSDARKNPKDLCRHCSALAEYHVNLIKDEAKKEGREFEVPVTSIQYEETSVELSAENNEEKNAGNTKAFDAAKDIINYMQTSTANTVNPQVVKEKITAFLKEIGAGDLFSITDRIDTAKTSVIPENSFHDDYEADYQEDLPQITDGVFRQLFEQRISQKIEALQMNEDDDSYKTISVIELDNDDIVTDVHEDNIDSKKNDIEFAEPVFTINSEPRSMEIVFGNSIETGEPLIWHPNDTQKLLHTNMGIIGTMGTGKTQFTKSIVTQLYQQQQNNLYGSPLGILIFDYKGDYNESKPEFIEATHARVLKPYMLPYNPFALKRTDKFIPRLPIHRASMIRDTIIKNFHLGDIQQSILIDCIVHAYAAANIDPDIPETWDRTAPTFEQVYEQYVKETSGKINDSLANVMKMIHQFKLFESDPKRACSLPDLLKGVVVIDLSGYDEKIQHLVVAITLDLFYSQMHALGSSSIAGQLRQMKYFILVDEADHFMRQQFASLEKIMKEGREFGVGTILSTQSLHHFFGGVHDDYAQYILTWDVHNVKDLNQREIEYLLSKNQSSANIAQMQNYIKNQRKHESVVMLTESGNVNPVPINDRPFWQLYEEINTESAEGGAIE